MKHKWQSKEDAIKTAEERTGEKFTILACPHCNHHANLTDPARDPDIWGGYQWSIVCSSSHCRARVCMVADGWFEQVDMALNPGYPSNGYRDRVTNLRDMWNRRAAPSNASEADGLANLRAILADQPFQNSGLSVYEINLILANEGGFMPDEAVMWFRENQGKFGLYAAPASNAKEANT